jgi:aryl carrier-like protein
MELMKKDFYEERQLDEQGLLTRGKLDELNLMTLVERLGV